MEQQCGNEQTRGDGLKQFLEAGEFVTTHGIMGELKLYPWSDGPAFLAGFTRVYLASNGQQVMRLEAARPHKNMCIVKLAGVNTIEDARPLVGKTVWINRQDVQLEPGRFFVQDLLGAKVLDADTHQEYGKVTGVLHPGPHDVYEIEGAGGEQYLFPAVEEFVVKRDIPAGEVWVRPIPGMFTPPEATGEPPKKTGTAKPRYKKEKPEHDSD